MPELTLGGVLVAAGAGVWGAVVGAGTVQAPKTRAKVIIKIGVARMSNPILRNFASYPTTKLWVLVYP